MKETAGLVPSQRRKRKLGAEKPGTSGSPGQKTFRGFAALGILILVQGSANSGQRPDFVNDDVSEHSCACSFTSSAAAFRSYGRTVK